MSEEPGKFRRFLERADERGKKFDTWWWRNHARVERLLVRLGVRTTVGWVGLLFIAAALVFAVYAITVLIVSNRSPLIPWSLIEGWAYVAAYILYFIVVCFVIIYALARRRVQKQRPGWKELALLGKVLHVLLTVACFALFLAPFAWIAWRAMTR